MTDPSLVHEIASALKDYADLFPYPELEDDFPDTAEFVKGMGDLLRRALAVLQQQGWQPIETAPKNQRVLVLVPARGCFVEGVFSAKHVRSENIGVDQWVFAPGGGRIPTTPTHWQPLPALPASASEGDKGC